MKSLKRSSGSSLPSPSNIPLSPINTHERFPHAGIQPGGLLSPWCHTSLSAGWAPAAGNWKVAISVAGASSG